MNLGMNASMPREINIINAIVCMRVHVVIPLTGCKIPYETKTVDFNEYFIL